MQQQQKCATSGCNKHAFPGGTHCSIFHRDQAVAHQVCATWGCGQPVHPGGNYCSISHRNQAAAQQQAWCKCGQPANPGKSMCTACYKNSLVPVQGQYLCSYKHPNGAYCNNRAFSATSPGCTTAHRDAAYKQGAKGPR